MTEIDLSAIKDGDEVRLRHDHNIIIVTAHIDGLNQDQLYCHAFGSRIYFGRLTRAGWQHCAGVRVVGHQPGLFE